MSYLAFFNVQCTTHMCMSGPPLLTESTESVIKLQAYTSQILAFVMFALMMSEDRVSMQPRRKQIIDGLRLLPGM